MRIASLTLERYGFFEDRELEFGPGLTLLTGQNEAGKSTLLDALSDLLWGFGRPVRHTYAAAASRLAISAGVSLAGQQHRLHRTTRGLTVDSAGSAEPAWGAGSAEARQAWRQGFGLDHATLREGGRQLCAGEGDLAELVFTARSGQDVRSIIARIDEEADGLYRNHRNSRSVGVRAAMTRFDDLHQQLDAVMTRAAAVAALEVTIRGLERDARDLQRDRDRARLGLRLAAQRARSFGQAVDLARTQAELAALRELGVALDEGQLARFDSATAARDAAADRLVGQQDQLDELRRRRALVHVDQALLADAAVIAELTQAAQARAADAERAASLRVQGAGLRRSAEHLVGELTGVAQRPVGALLAELQVPIDRVADLAVHSELVRAAERAAADADAAELTALGEVRVNVVDAAAFGADAVRCVHEARRAVEAQDSAVTLRRQAIGHRADAIVQARKACATAGCLLAEDDGRLPDPPPPDRVATLRDSLRAAAAVVAAADRDRDRAQERVHRAAQDLAAHTAEGRCPGLDELTRARSDRNRQFDHLMAVLAAGGESHAVTTAAVTLERAVKDADRVADDVIAAGNWAAEQRRRRATVDAAEAELGVITRDAENAARRHRFAAAQWSALWAAHAVREPGPDTADTVLAALDELHRAESERQHAQSRIDGLAEAAREQESALRASLATAGVDRDGADLSALLVAAADVEEKARAARDQQVRVTEIRERARRTSAAADARRHDLQEAMSRWRFALRVAGLPTEMTPAAWDLRHDRLTEARQTVDEAVSLDAEADLLQRRFDDHRLAVLPLLGRHGAGHTDIEAGLVALAERVEMTRSAEITAGHLDGQIRDAANILRSAQDAVTAADTERDGLAEEISADHLSDLAAAAVRGARSSKLNAVESRLTALVTAAAPDLSLADWLVESDSHDQAGLADLQGAAEHVVATIDKQYDGVLEQLGDARRRLTDLENAAPAASLHAESQEQLARAAEAAERYVVLHLQRQVLREELESYERRHSSPLLNEAGTLLEQLTDGRYVALRPAAAAGGPGARSLVVVRADEQELSTDQLSEGTADQLFLALRLAGVAQRQRDRARRGLPLLPVVLDDLLTTFDDDRAAAAISVLADLATDWQILLLTHHDHLAALPLRPNTRPVAVVALDRPTPLERVRDADRIRSEVMPWPAPRTPATTPQIDDVANPSDVRAWARANGHDVGERGRISAEIRSAYLHRA